MRSAFPRPGSVDLDLVSSHAIDTRRVPNIQLPVPFGFILIYEYMYLLILNPSWCSVCVCGFKRRNSGQVWLDGRRTDFVRQRIIWNQSCVLRAIGISPARPLACTRCVTRLGQLATCCSLLPGGNVVLFFSFIRVASTCWYSNERLKG